MDEGEGGERRGGLDVGETLAKEYEGGKERAQVAQCRLCTFPFECVCGRVTRSSSLAANPRNELADGDYTINRNGL